MIGKDGLSEESFSHCCRYRAVASTTTCPIATISPSDIEIELSTHTQAFSGRMENLNMHFYDGNKSLAYHEYVERERMPSNNIYAITLPANDYHHLPLPIFRRRVV